ncbi:MAG: hypothetical protein KF862_18630 [Chitinophagaceae bacterium]|nr:hypothetical protein [Chitinophagaceae bacterium]
MAQDFTGHEPGMRASIIGFGSYYYKSGRSRLDNAARAGLPELNGRQESVRVLSLSFRAK